MVRHYGTTSSNGVKGPASASSDGERPSRRERHPRLAVAGVRGRPQDGILPRFRQDALRNGRGCRRGVHGRGTPVGGLTVPAAAKAVRADWAPTRGGGLQLRSSATEPGVEIGCPRPCTASLVLDDLFRATQQRGLNRHTEGQKDDEDQSDDRGVLQG